MPETVIQRTFAAGEIGPALYARSDQVKYQTGLRRCRNFVVRKHGGVANRTGLEFTDYVRNDVDKFRQIKFVFSTGEAYNLVLADGVMRIYQQGSFLKTLTAPAWADATGYVIGQIVLGSDGWYYCIADHTSSAGVNEPPSSSWFKVQGYYVEVPIPWAGDDLATLQYTQSGDVIYVAHGSYAPQAISRFLVGSQLAWKVQPIQFNVPVPRPSVASISGTAGSARVRYKVTTAQRGTFIESLPGSSGTFNVVTITKANPAVVKVATDLTSRFAAGDVIEINGPMNGMNQILNQEFTIASVAYSAPNTEITLLGVDSSGWDAYVNGGVVNDIEIRSTLTYPESAKPVTVTATPQVNAAEYYFYRSTPQGYGYVGSSTNGVFVDTGYLADLSEVPPQATNVFLLDEDFPAVVALAQQRLLFANLASAPEKISLSRIGEHLNFTTRNPLQDDDAFSFAINSKEVAPIRHVIELEKVVVLTNGGEWVIAGDESTGAIIPTAINPKAQAYNGSTTLRPVLINDTIIYAGNRGATMRDFKYAANTDGGPSYNGRDLTVFAEHLFEKRTMVAMDYERQTSLLWAVRDDGALLGLTYLPEHRVWGWHRHNTDGSFRDVVTVPEPGRDVSYFIVERQIGGETKFCIERLADFEIENPVTDVKYADSFVIFDGRGIGTGTVTISGGSTWGPGEQLTLTSSSGMLFNPDMTENAAIAFIETVRVTGDDEDPVRYETREVFRVDIGTVVSGSIARGVPSKTVPAAYRSTALDVSLWAVALKVLSPTYVSMTHLLNKNLSIYADGVVVSDGVSDPLYSIADNGTLTLDRPRWYAVIGLPYNCDLETLDIELQDGGMRTLVGKSKRVPQVVVTAEYSRGLRVGADFDHLHEYKQREWEAMGSPTIMKTGTFEVGVTTTWDNSHRICIRQSDPLPLTVLSIAPSIDIGG